MCIIRWSDKCQNELLYDLNTKHEHKNASPTAHGTFITDVNGRVDLKTLLLSGGYNTNSTSFGCQYNSMGTCHLRKMYLGNL